MKLFGADIGVVNGRHQEDGDLCEARVGELGLWTPRRP
jgi:hypothetical protein